MKNVVIRDENGRILTRVESLNVSQRGLKAFCADNFGVGVYRASWREYTNNPGKGKGSKPKRKGTVRNRQVIVYENDIREGEPIIQRAGAANVLRPAFRERYPEQTDTLKDLAKNIATEMMETVVKPLIEKIEQFDDDDDEEEYEEDVVENLISVFRQPKYEGIIQAFFSSQSNEERAQKLSEVLQGNPLLIREALVDVLSAFNTTGAN